MGRFEEWARRAGIAGDVWPAARCRAVEAAMCAAWAVLAVIWIAVGA